MYPFVYAQRLNAPTCVHTGVHTEVRCDIVYLTKKMKTSRVFVCGECLNPCAEPKAVLKKRCVQPHILTGQRPRVR